MSFWSGERLLQRLEHEKLIDPFDKDLIDCAAYTLTLGGHAFTSGDDEAREAAAKKGETPGIVRLGQGETVTIRAGQFAFLLTEESVTIPHDALGFISVKASQKFAGLINVSGFHVDPGWSSPLIFGVFNAGPHELVFERGQQLFLLFYADLEKTSGKVRKNQPPYDHIPATLIQKMAGEVPSLYKLNKSASELKAKISELESKMLIATGTAGIAILISLGMFTKVLFSSPPGSQAAQQNVPVVSSMLPEPPPSIPSGPVQSKVEPPKNNPKDGEMKTSPPLQPPSK